MRICPALVAFDITTDIFTFKPITNFTVGANEVADIWNNDVGVLATTIEIFDEGVDVEIDPVEEDIDMDYEETRSHYEVLKKTLTCNFDCGAWEDEFYTGDIILEKFGKRGKITIPKFMKPIKLAQNYGTNQIYISHKHISGERDLDTQLYNFFYGLLPQNVDTPCKVKTYCTDLVEDKRNCKVVEGNAYHTANIIKIAPCTQYYRYFNKLTNSEVEIQDIGINEQFTIEFEIQDHAGSYPMGASVPEFSIYKFVYQKKYYANWNPWENPYSEVTVRFFKYFNDDIPRIQVLEASYKSTLNAKKWEGSIQIPILQDEIMGYFGQYIAAGWVQPVDFIWCKTFNSYDDPTNVIVKGAAFYANDCLCIVPNTDDRKKFINYAGLTAGFMGFYGFTFIPELVDKKPTSYTNYRPDKQQTIS